MREGTAFRSSPVKHLSSLSHLQGKEDNNLLLTASRVKKYSLKVKPSGLLPGEKLDSIQIYLGNSKVLKTTAKIITR